MKRQSLVAAMVVVCGMALGATCQVAPPDTGKMSWDLFEEVKEMEQRSATGEDVEAITAFFVTGEPITNEQAELLGDLGYSMVGSYGHFALVDAPGTLYSDPERGVGTLDFISNAALPPAPIAYDYNTEGVVAMGADAAHRLGYTGEGTKIAIIDGGFDPDNPILQASSAVYYKVRPDPEIPGRYFWDVGEVAKTDPHGTSCAIIAADVAPEAELYLITFEPGSSLVGWLMAMDFATYQLGVDAISCSIGFMSPTCHADGTGPLNSAVSSIFRGTDTIMFLAAGNSASGTGTEMFYGGKFSDSDGDFAHDFTTDAVDAWDRNGLRFYGEEGDPFVIVLEWDDWDSALGKVDLDLILSYDEYEYKVGASQARQFERQGTPTEFLWGTLPYTGYYSLSVEDQAAKWHNQSVCSVSFHINLRNERGLGFIEHHMAGGSVSELATNRDVVTVGAVSLQNSTQEPYSSRGPTSDGRPKPELSGPAGVTGTVYPVYHGTSAAAPYVASAFAVLKTALPELSGAEVYQHLVDTARCSNDEYGNRICVVDLEAAIATIEENQ